MSAGLRLNNSVSIRYKIQVTDSTQLSNMSMEVTAEGSEPVRISSDEFISVGGDCYYIYFNQLNAGQMSVPLNATVYIGEGENKTAVSNTLRYSVESYVDVKKNDANANLVKMLQEMIKYGHSANNYAY